MPHVASTRRRARARAAHIGLMALFVASVLVVSGGQLARGGEARFETLDDAVMAGALDAAVLDALRDRGHADAIIFFDDQGMLARAAEAGARDRAPGGAVAVLRSEAASLRLPTIRALTDAGGEILTEYEHLPASFVRFGSEESLLAVLNRPEVTSVNAEMILRPATLESGVLVRQPQAIAMGHTGAGTSVAVLDTGVDYRRSAFGVCTGAGVPATCRVAVSRDIAPDDGRLDDAGLHGTNVAGIVAAIAPATKLVVLDVIRSDGTASSSELMTAIDWVIRNGASYNVRAMNLSLGSGSYGSSCPPDPGLRAAMAAGILPVVAAGNGGQTSGVGWPACVADAVAVGAVYDADVGRRSYAACTDATTSADRIACFSQSGSNLDILAPGAIVSAAGVSMAGTSQAAPHVAAAAAMLVSATPEALASDVRDALVQSGPTIVDARNGVTRRRLDIHAALQTFLGVTGGGIDPPPAAPAPAPSPTPSPPTGPDGHPFVDIDGSPFENDIIWIYQRRVTAGCMADRYCPNAPVLRDQMASFLVRALALPPSSVDFFGDDEGNMHEDAINRLAAAGVTLGCAPRRYCPGGTVTREQMASFLTRAAAHGGETLPPTSRDYFMDDDGSTHEVDINRAAAAGITRGCTATTFCPRQAVTRGQMAAFLRRTLE